MSEDEKIPAALRNNPKFRSIQEALESYSAGEPITARCPECDQVLTVELIEAVDTLWVACPTGCTTYREKYAPGTLSKKDKPK